MSSACENWTVFLPVLIAGILSASLYFHQTLIRLWWSLWFFLGQTRVHSKILHWLHHFVASLARVLNNKKESNDQLFRWVAKRADRLQNRTPDNFGECWTDGVLLSALAESFSPGSCPRYDLMTPDNAYSNVKAAMVILEQKTGINSGLEAEDIVRCSRGSEHKLRRFVSKLRRHNLITSDESKAEDSSETNPAECLARGKGLSTAVKDEPSQFNLYLRSMTRLNIVVDIRGPLGTACSERISDRSPRRKRPPLPVISSEDEDLQKNKARIPLEYEVMSGMVSVTYTPLEFGKHNIGLIWQGQHIIGSPFSVTVEQDRDLASVNESAEEVDTCDALISRLSVTRKTSEGGSRKAGTTVRRKILRHIVSVQGRDVVMRDAQQLPLALMKSYTSDESPNQQNPQSQEIAVNNEDCSATGWNNEDDEISSIERVSLMKENHDDVVDSASSHLPLEKLRSRHQINEECQQRSSENCAEEREQSHLDNISQQDAQWNSRDSQDCKSATSIPEDDDVFFSQDIDAGNVVEHQWNDNETTQESEIFADTHCQESVNNYLHVYEDFLEVSNGLANKSPLESDQHEETPQPKESGLMVSKRRKFFERLAESQTNSLSRNTECSQRSPSFRKAREFWETSSKSKVPLSLSPVQQPDVTATQERTSFVESQNGLVKIVSPPPPGSDGDSGIHVPSHRHRRSRSDPCLNSFKQKFDDNTSSAFPLLFRTNPLFMLEPGAFADDLTSSPTTFDDRGFIDDEIPDYAAQFMGGGYVSFTGLLDGDRLMSRRELLMGLEASPITHREEEELLLPRAEKCRALGSGLYYGQVGMRNHFKVTTDGAGKGFLTVSIQGAGDHDVTEVITTYTGHNTYEVMYEVTEPGYYIIAVKWSEWNVPESPFICKVTY